ncbi:hypothetical protein [Paenibacillus sp. YYML68]|uniref:XkdQ/YqbQ family protein n=1 Tax=Paenibacillus sp. YYML68 TaxID=2909250 RepID=UPI002493006C|nr:hypothetical protein [Paenibacillus sp. YYML68]
MLEVLIDNKNGNVWDISSIVSKVTWKSSRIGKASNATISFVKGGLYESKSFQYGPGDIIRIRLGDRNVFYGYLFTISGGKTDIVQLTAYDQLRYLLASDTYVFKNVTATEVIRRIAGDFSLKLGELADTVYRIPTMVEDGKKLLDIICTALDRTLMATGKHYVFYDQSGSLMLRDVLNLRVDVAVGDGSLMHDYDYTTSIDSETYNRIKLVRDNKETKKREVYIAQDSATIAKWGRLQFYQKVDDGYTDAQLKELLDNLLQLKNRERKSLRVEAIGDISIRAGCMVPIMIEERGIHQYFLVDECTHLFEGADHTMTLELKVI